MTIEIHYFSPTTPGASSFDVDVSTEARRGRIGPFSGEAQMAAVGSGAQVLDDIDSTLGHSSDGILGLKQWYVDETACPSGNQRVYTGYTFNRTYARGDSLVTGSARKVDVTLMDPNAFLDFRVFAPADLDPTSSFVRPAEDTYERIQALLAVDFLSTTLFDLGYIPTTGAKDLDATDYTGQKPADVVRDIANVLGWNPWVGYDETENKLFLWFDDWMTDGADTIPYDSTLKLTNVESESNGTDTFLIELNGVESVDPSRVISAVYVMGKGTNVYRTRPETAYTFGWRDSVMQAQFLSDPVKLAALGDRWLLDNSTEDHKITCTVQVPAALVTAIHEGMRIEIHATHMPSAAAGFTWTRILHRTVRVDVETQEYYWLDLELSPIAVAAAYMFGFLIQRDASAYGPGIVPSGTDDGGGTFSDPWTHLSSASMIALGTNGVDAAYVEVGPEHAQWAWHGSGGTSRPTGHNMILRGACGPPVLLAQRDGPGATQDAVLTMPPVVAPGDGMMFAEFGAYRLGGDGGVGGYVLESPLGATVLADTAASANPSPAGFFPRAWLGYMAVTQGQSVTWQIHEEFDQGVNWCCMVVFVPGGGDLEIVEFSLTGSIDALPPWSWATAFEDIDPGSCG